ncbi:MAG: hypothetical protein AAGC60_25985 [Acidobacteriota bacterium]
MSATSPPPHLSLEPPPGFVQAERFVGWLHRGAGASLRLVEWPAPLDASIAGFDDRERLDALGQVLEQVDEVEVDGRRGRLFVHRLEGVDGVSFVRLTLALGDDEETLFALAVVPASERDELVQPLRRSLLGLRWRPDQRIDPFDGLGYKVDRASFAVCQRAGEGLLLSDPPQPSGEGMALVVARSLEPTRVVNRERFAVQRIQSQTARVHELVEHHPVRQGGLDGLRTVARVDSLDPHLETTGDDSDRLAAQIVLFDRLEVFVLWTELAGDRAQDVERFDEVAAGFRRLVPSADSPDSEGDDMPSPSDLARLLDEAVALAFEHAEAERDALAEHFAARHPGVDREWAGAIAGEAWFLRFNTEMLADMAEFLDGGIEPLLRQRLPGFSDVAYRRALDHSGRVAPDGE